MNPYILLAGTGYLLVLSIVAAQDHETVNATHTYGAAATALLFMAFATFFK